MERLDRPYNFFYNQFDAEEIKATLTQMKNKNIDPLVPFEFTHEGMLQRIHAYVEHQDFCDTETSWAPKTSVKIKFGQPGESCNEVCESHHRVCEQSWFQLTNLTDTILAQTHNCLAYRKESDIIAPFFDDNDKTCVFQGDKLLYSCAGNNFSARRICPCRDFIKNQVALCKDCK